MVTTQCPACNSKATLIDTDSRQEWYIEIYFCARCNKNYHRRVTYATQSDMIESDVWDEFPNLEAIKEDITVPISELRKVRQEAAKYRTELQSLRERIEELSLKDSTELQATVSRRQGLRIEHADTFNRLALFLLQFSGYAITLETEGPFQLNINDLIIQWHDKYGNARSAYLSKWDQLVVPTIDEVDKELP